MLEGMVIRMAGDGAGTDETKMMSVRIVLRMQLSERRFSLKTLRATKSKESTKNVHNVSGRSVKMA